MKLDLWTKINGPQYIVQLNETAWRLVEAQHIFSTRKLVDSAAEQEILEEIIEAVKPSNKAFSGIHPLLYTPFRYPPLPYGSRFGKQTEASLWYGSIELFTAMAEKAFYQFHFLRASKAEFGVVEVTLTAFSTPITTQQGVYLSREPFSQHLETISSPVSYTVSQNLGSTMRAQGIEAFTYISARDPKAGTNVALFTPKAFQTKTPHSDSFQTWHCTHHANTVEFMRASTLQHEQFIFPLENFLIDQALPLPP